MGQGTGLAVTGGVPLPHQTRSRRRPWTRLVRAAWLLAGLALVNLSIGCGPTWPTVRAVSHPEFAANPKAVATIDVLPVDIDVSVDPQTGYDPAAIAAQIRAEVHNALATGLNERGFQPIAIQWTGTDQPVSAPAPAPARAAPEFAPADGEPLATAEPMAGSQAPGAPQPVEPLAVYSSSDATLYVGGWTRVAKPRHADAGKALKSVAFVVFAVALVALVVVAAAGSGSKSKKSGKARSSRSGKVGRSRGRSGRTSRVRDIMSRGRRRGSGSASRPRSTGGQRPRSTSRVRDIIGSAGSGGGGRSTARDRRPSRRRAAGSSSSRRRYRTRARTAARVTTDLVIDVLDGPHHSRPTVHYRRAPVDRHIPRTEYGAMELEMTLVSNKTGEVQWHARQRFEVAAQNRKHLRKAVRKMLAALPNTRSGKKKRPRR